ncbi:MAG TPA: 1,4-alpha-glucan branching protein GlgB [Mobilitalea sp.]|nr:1,4-alpha-glucan branching protein GlgB [Mobilitalea sp.]
MAQKRNPGEVTDEQIYLFHEGTNYRSYQILGAHLIKRGKNSGAVFRVWAPNASWVSVVGDFNQWNLKTNPMTRVKDSDIWEVFVPEAGEEQLYKYAIGTSHSEVLYKYDPYAYYSELRPKTASAVYDLSGYTWNDKAWQQKKKAGKKQGKPMLIYEVHLGSWRRHDDGSLMNYREIADELVDYVVDMGYTHIELMPVMEHPFDGSWGYQIVGYYAATSRYGTPKDFMYLVDLCHQKDIGVILDWVPGHFPKDAHGLIRFDGSALYEHPDPRRGEHPQWGTLIFNYERNEVRSFLISNLLFWLEYYHVDGFRVDAVASMLYYDYAREDWLPNKFGGRENLDAAEFLKKMNETVASLYPNTLVIAEDSSQWPLVTGAVEQGGLGFTHKWNMGWMNDTLKYCSLDPIYRKWHHNLLTFSLTYAFSEKYVLPLSHDEVVHGKHSLLDKMPGDYQQKFAGLRSLFGYMAAHPGNKLTFMGDEFGHFIEWKYDDQLDWFLLDYEMHRKMKDYVKALNHFYRDTNCLWEDDGGWNGYQWISPNDSDQSILSFMRKGTKPGDYVMVVINFTPVHRPQYRMGVPMEQGFTEIFNSDRKEFGGAGRVCTDIIPSESVPCHGFEQSVLLSVPPLSAVFYKPA